MRKTSLPKEFEFGEKVLVIGKITRIVGKIDPIKYAEDGIGYSRTVEANVNLRTWFREEIEPTEALFLCYRTLANGSIEVDNHGEDGIDRYFAADEHIRGAWICKKGRNPEKVFLSDCKKIQSQPTEA